jgi:hypothetical protein
LVSLRTQRLSFGRRDWSLFGGSFQAPERVGGPVTRMYCRVSSRIRGLSSFPDRLCPAITTRGFSDSIRSNAALVRHGVQNLVVDSSSIEVNRRARRTETARVDLDGLLRLLARYLAAERRGLRTFNVVDASTLECLAIEVESSLNDNRTGSDFRRWARGQSTHFYIVL